MIEKSEGESMRNTVQLYYFSPTGGTLACGEMLCKGLASHISAVNLGARETVAAPEGELVVFALPVYSGRIPALAAEKIAALQGAGKQAVTLAVYGVRAYEDALLELNTVAAAAGFQVVASAAVIARHSIVPAVGAGRPDEEDARSITEFAQKVLEKLEKGDMTAVSVPGNVPYRDVSAMNASPVCLPQCGSCGICAAVCPTEAITVGDEGVYTDAAKCILCMGCTAVCPQQARVLPQPLQESLNEKLSALIEVRRENEYFL